ncbi:MAG: recombinase family protein [Anaeroplasmataceae bacterium]|nr:recombinase family protein [Anaeroplasmataceae bacterium]
MNNNCVIYARFSSHGQNEQSIEAQVRICKEFAEGRGLNVINIYPEKARTGTNDNRPAFQKMIADAQTGTFQYIIVYMMDRFARNRRDSIMYKEMLKEKNGVKVLSALEPIAEDEGGEFYEMFLEWNAEKYSKRLSKRVRDGLDTSVANGTYCGGQLIYGYKIEQEPIAGKPNKFVKRVAINPEEAEIVKFVFTEYDKGTPKKQIAEELNKKGLRYKGKPFKGRTFDHYLENAKYTGEFYFGGRLCDNMYPPIIDKELFQRVQKQLNKNKYFAGGVASAKVPYLLTGKLFCGYCDTEMVSDGGTSKTGEQHHYYTCKKRRKHLCRKKRENRDMLERFVVDCVVDFLSDKQNAAVAVDDVLNYYEKRTDSVNIKAIATKISNAEKEIGKLTDAFVNANNALLRKNIEIKMAEYEILLKDLSAQKSQLELERGRKVNRKDLLDYIEVLIKGDREDKEYQKRIIDYLVTQVVVFDDNAVCYLTIKGGKDINTIDIVDNLIGKCSGKVQTQTQLSRHLKPKSNIFGLGYFYNNYFDLKEKV